MHLGEEGVANATICERVIWIGLDSRFEIRSGLPSPVLGPIEKRKSPAEIEFVYGRVHEFVLRCARPVRGKLHGQRLCDTAGNLILHSKNVGEVLVESAVPQVSRGANVD